MFIVEFLFALTTQLPIKNFFFESFLISQATSTAFNLVLLVFYFTIFWPRHKVEARSGHRTLARTSDSIQSNPDPQASSELPIDTFVNPLDLMNPETGCEIQAKDQDHIKIQVRSSQVLPHELEISTNHNTEAS